MATQNLTNRDQQAHEPGEINLVELWLRKDPIRWLAGAMAGLFAGMIAAVFAGLLASFNGLEFWYPIKIAALPFLGASALQLGSMNQAVPVGMTAHGALALVLGVVYAHFTATNSIKALLGAGFAWGAFSWIFIVCLFIQSFTDVFAAQISLGAAFFVMMVFGFMLSSVAFFDRAFRRN